MSEMVFVLGEIKFIYTDVEVEGGISLNYQFAFFRYFIDMITVCVHHENCILKLFVVPIFF